MNNKINHIYWFAGFNPECPSTRYRGIIPLDFMKTQGINFDFVYPQMSLKDVIRFVFLYLKIILFSESNSIIVIQKVYSNRIYANALKFLIRVKKNTVYDIDDAEQYRHRTNTIIYFLKHCKYVTVGSNFLKKYCSEYNKNVILQTSPLTSPIHQVKTNKNKKLHIGWVGDFGNGNKISEDFSHKTSLFKLLFPVLSKIKYPIKLSLIGIKMPNDIMEIKSYFNDHKNIELDIPENLDWKNDSWVYDSICEFDLGISLMVDHPFNRGKSAFKAKQYLVCGVPVLANNIGETLHFVIDDFNGYISNNETEIINSINSIKKMSDDSYKELSNNTLVHINDFSVNRYCNILLSIAFHKKGRIAKTKGNNDNNPS